MGRAAAWWFLYLRHLGLKCPTRSAGGVKPCFGLVSRANGFVAGLVWSLWSPRFFRHSNLLSKSPFRSPNMFHLLNFDGILLGAGQIDVGCLGVVAKHNLPEAGRLRRPYKLCWEEKRIVLLLTTTDGGKHPLLNTWLADSETFFLCLHWEHGRLRPRACQVMRWAWCLATCALRLSTCWRRTCDQVFG